MLAVDVHQEFTTLAHQSQGHGCIVDKRAALATAAHFAPEDTVRGIVIDIVFLKEVFEMVITQIEMRLDDAFVSSFLDLSGVSALS